MSSNMAWTRWGAGAVRGVGWPLSSILAYHHDGWRRMRASRRAGEVGLRIENQFEVQAPIDDVWNYLLDVERVAPCMPGAELTEVVDENTYKGKAGVKLGPVNMSFSGTVVLQERNE